LHELLRGTYAASLVTLADAAVAVGGNIASAASWWYLAASFEKSAHVLARRFENSAREL
jgi:hypothetical protein